MNDHHDHQHMFHHPPPLLPHILMSEMTYNQMFLTILGTCVFLIVLTFFWIVAILIRMEATKTTFFYGVDGEDGTAANSLEMTVTTTSSSTGNNANGMEVEESSVSEMSSASSPKSTPSYSIKKRTGRRVQFSFKLMQFASVSAVLLLIYLILVVSKAPAWATILGSLCVFVIFFRYQIGDEWRGRRKDRIALLLTLFLFLASLMSMCTYCWKSLADGEIYEGPARIVEYDQSQYTNDEHDLNTRADLKVEWGKDWGCPLSGSKLCQADVHGAMCTVNLEPGDRQRRHRRRTRRSGATPNQKKKRTLQSHPTSQSTSHTNAASPTTTTSHASATNSTGLQANTTSVTSSPTNVTNSSSSQGDLAQENEHLNEEVQDLESENEKLEKEVEEMQLEEEKTETIAEEEVEEVKDEEAADAATYNEEVDVVEEEEMEVEEEFTDAYIEVEEEEVQTEEKYETDPSKVSEQEDEIEDLKDEESEVDEIYDSYADELEQDAEDEAEEANEDQQAEEDVQVQEEETETNYDEEIEEVEGEINEGEEVENGEEYNIDGEGEDDFFWNELTYEYDDDYYETEYWEYDWNSAWGEYACEDLFDADADMTSYDVNVKAGEDGYPFINIYGSCKTCEAYILDYFAEDAFASVQLYREQASLYFWGSVVGAIYSLLSYIKYRVMPPPENEVELLGEHGAMA